MKARHILLSLFLLLVAACQDDTVTIAYQGMANPWKHLIKTKAFDDISKAPIDWKKFNSGAKIINAMASGDVDVAVLGSTPLASALGQGLPIKVVWVMGVIGESEALVAKKEIRSLEALKGKKVATPFGSTSHYHLLLALKNKDIDPNSVEIFNLSPSGIVSSWKTGQMDAAYVSAPALEEIKKDGNVLITSADLAESGDPTFDAIVAREEFAKKNGDFIQKLLGKINQLHTRLSKENWTVETPEVQNISQLVGSSPKDVITSLNGYEFPLASEQASEKLLGGGLSEALLKTSKFLKEQGKIRKAQEDYRKFLDPSFAQNILKSEK